MRVLVACEESQAVCKEFRVLGHEAYSCDIQECSGGHPEWHIQGDVREILGDGWDLLIAHPVCRYLTNSGVRWLHTQPGRWEKMREGAEFFKVLLNAPIPRKAIENPIPHKYALEIIGRKYDQIVHPHWFGELENKATCWWLEGLPLLEKTNNVKEQMRGMPKNQTDKVHYMAPGPEREKLRSRTLPGPAKAMAQQWGGKTRQSGIAKPDYCNMEG